MGALLLAALVSQTSGFRILDGAVTLLVSGAIVAYVVFRLLPIQYKSGGVSALLYWNTVASVAILSHGILAGERYLWTLAAKMLVVSVFFTALQGAFHRANPNVVLRKYADIILWLCVLNAAVAVVVAATGAPPLFTRPLGEFQPREYQHYILAATEDGLRFISYFGEPSDFAWIGCSAAFVHLALGKPFRAVIVAICIIASFSGSLLFVYGLLLAYLGGAWLLAMLGAVWLAAQNLDGIFDLASATPVLDSMVIRFFSSDGDLHLSRTDQFAAFFRSFSLLPHPLDEEAVLSAPNGSFLLLLRYGLLYLPLFVWFLLILLAYIRRAWAVNKALAFVLVAFLVCLAVRESPLFNLLFWIPFEAIRRLVNGESPMAVRSTVVEGIAASEGLVQPTA